MKNNKFFFGGALLIAAALSLTGCKKCIDTKTSTVEVRIVDEYHRNAYTSFMYVNKMMHPIHHSEINRITVKYKDMEFDLDGAGYYDKYYTKIGDKVNGTLETKYYDNNTTEYKIVDLE